MTRNIFLSTFAAREHFSKHRSCEFAAQYSISKPPTSLSCGKPLGSPSSSSLSDTIFAVTSSSSSVKSNVIFFKPKPAFLRIWFCVAVTLGTRGNSLAKSGRPKAGETSVRSEVSEASEGPNASSLWWRTPTVSLC